MELINPIKLETSNLFLSNVPENDYALWTSTTAYVVTNRIIFNHKIYECLVNNSNVVPDTSTTGATPNWLEVGYTNKYKCIDDKYGTQTVFPGQIVLVFNIHDAFDSISFLNTSGTTIHIVSTVQGNVIYNRTVPLASGVGTVFDWYSYFFGTLGSAVDTLYVNDIPAVENQQITLTITGVGNVAIGNVVFGSYITLGRLLMRPKIGIISYSKKDTNEFGETVVVPRAFAKRFSAQFILDNGLIDQLVSILANIRDTPCVWLGLGTTYTSLVVWGFYKDFEISLEYTTESVCDITIEGLI